MTKLWGNKMDDSEERAPNRMFLDWASGKEFFTVTEDPQVRTQKIIVEIQKRSLAEQVLVLSWNEQNRACSIASIAPPHDEPIFSSKIQLRLLQIAKEEERVLLYDDVVQDEWIKEKLDRYRCKNLIIYPLLLNGDRFDALLIINYSAWSDPVKSSDFFTFVAAVLCFSLQNTRLYQELMNKDRELRDWSQHVENRIEEGTRKILEKESQYHALFEGVNDGVIVHDVSGKILEANHVACHLLGYAKKELLSHSWADLTSRNDLPEQEAYFLQALRNEKNAPLETHLIKHNKDTLIAEINSRRVWIKGKGIIQSFIRDISQRKTLEESLRETKEKYRMLVESSLMGVFIFRQGNIFFVNQMFARIIGQPKENLIDDNFYNFIATEDRSRVKNIETRREENADDVPPSYEARFITKEGEKRWGEFRTCRVILDGRPAILGNLIDINDRKRLELHLLETQKMESVGTLAGGIAHDFNNLLGGILGYASLLLSDMTQDHPFYQDIMAIAETSKRGADLTGRLLAFARGGKYKVTTVDINKVVDDVINILTHSIDRSIQVNAHLEENLWDVKGDGSQIHQSIHNICINSRDALPNGGKIDIRTDNVQVMKNNVNEFPGLEMGEYVLVRISDTGVGMDDVTRSRAFEPFFSTKPPGTGTGLGLSMVYGVLKNHDGATLLESELGAGTTVTLCFPRYQLEKPLAKPLQQGEKDTILLVDDEDVIRTVGRRMLEKGGYKVITAADGAEAEKIFREKKDIILLTILDLIMPNIDGKETYHRLNKIDPDVKVVFTSGYGLEDRPEFKQLDGKPFIKKPFQTELLISLLEDLLNDANEQNV